MSGEKDSEKSIGAPHRLGALDALRLIAAWVVFREHFYVIFEVHSEKGEYFGLLDAKGAVTLFFVLSGYVLSISLRRTVPSFRAYLNFGLRRVFRIYPLYWVALAMTFGVLVFAYQREGLGYLSDMPATFLDNPGLQTKQWLLQTTLVAPGMLSYFALPTVWTLMVEAKIAVIFPWLFWLMTRLNGWAATALLAGLVLGSAWLHDHVIGTASFLGQFALGIMLYRIPEDFWKKLNGFAWCVLLAISLFLYRAMSLRYFFTEMETSLYLCAFGSTGFIAATLHWPVLRSAFERLQKLLRLDISYGIYILHYPILMGLRWLWLDGLLPVSAVWLFILAALLTIVLAYLLHRYVEIPCIQLGRRLTQVRTNPPGSVAS